MPRSNKITACVLPNKMKYYVEFLTLDNEKGLNVSDLMKSIKTEYLDLMTDHYDHLEKMSKMEEIIIQFRCKEVIESELRLSLNRNKKNDMTYVYARTLFYRSKNKIKDIRVCIGSVDQYGNHLNGLINDVEFRKICVDKLKGVIDKEIESNIINLKLITNEKN
jgi:hypothetical protein